MNYCKLILRNNNTLWKCIRGIRQKNVTTPDDVNNENEKLEKLFELDKPFYGEKEEEKKRLDEINFDHIPIEKQVVIFCPGQGAQTVGMLEETKKNNPKALQLFDKASEILGYDLQSVIDKGPASKLNQTIYTQPAIVVSSLVAYENLKLLRPDVEETLTHIAGFSVGEYTAAVISGILSFSDALKIIK
ncbi:Malonyl-CoA-acyl carrier protein transacylase, mitochondrial [Strongyloides ratti]|uniref:Malonyl-CoA-acyl carrier protein transacylase, mitochondrial n=1 Tax=Strongyloides ratti TaxID=34506 RepID=A0A090L2I7_STRRB|nr:Malonyl-CoA-acyl carrier protein transacylase, mitochondrial [Strongyloides ratti]CEF62307.1 Malonyl-CoA-acyl carrier protein transacylase, mitochondrial [Strongyloides ratti]